MPMHRVACRRSNGSRRSPLRHHRLPLGSSVPGRQWDVSPRLLSHAHFRELGVGSELWSISRGLARQVDRYKAKLMGADEPRRGDLDGRGNLTLAGLEAFCAFFLEISLDQVAFMEGLFGSRWSPCDEWKSGARRKIPRQGPFTEAPGRCSGKPSSWASSPEGAPGSITGYEERQSRTVLTQLLARGLLVSDGPRAAVRLGFSHRRGGALVSPSSIRVCERPSPRRWRTPVSPCR